MKPKAAPKKVNPLLKPAENRNMQGAHALTIINRIKRGAAVPAWAVKGAGIRAPATAPKRRGA